MVKEVMTGSYIRNGEVINFNFYTDLKVKEKINFVNDITDTLIGENYNSVLRDMLFDYKIISMFTDVDLSDMNEVKDSISYIEDFLDETDVVDIVKANVNDGLIDELNKALDDNIEYRTGIRKTNLNDALTQLVNTIEKKISSIDTEEMMEVAAKFNNIIGQIDTKELIDAYMGK